MNQPLISVIVPVYNVEAYLKRCMDSIVGQTYTNLEIILVDDGSVDQSGAICDEYRGMDSRVRVIHKENGGAASARNAGLNIASGAYIAFVDSDDWINDNFLETLMAEIEDGDVCVCGIHSITDGQIITKEIPRPCVLEGKAAVDALINGTEMINYVVWNKLYKADILKDVRFPEGKLAEDFYFTGMAVFYSRKTVLTDKCWYNYLLRRPGCVTSIQTTEAWHAGAEALFDNTRYFLEKGEPELAQMSARRAFLLCINIYRDIAEKTDKASADRSYAYFKQMKKKYSSLLGEHDPIRLINSAFVICPNGIAALQKMRRQRKER